MFNLTSGLDSFLNPVSQEVAHYSVAVIPAGETIGGTVAQDGQFYTMTRDPLEEVNPYFPNLPVSKIFSTEDEALNWLMANYPPDQYDWALKIINVNGEQIERVEIDNAAPTESFVSLEELQGALPDGIPGWDYEATNAALYADVTKDSTTPIPPGLPSPWWNPQGFMNVTKNGVTLGMVPNWGQEILTPLDLAKPSIFFMDSYIANMSEGEKQNILNIYGGGYSAVTSPRIFMHYKEQTSGMKPADEYTYWLCWLLGCTIYVNVTNDFKIVSTGPYYPLQEARLIDAYRYQYYKSRQPMPASQMQFCTGNYFGWDKQYKNNAWFKLAVDTATSWRFNDKNKVDVKTPFTFNYAPELFAPYDLDTTYAKFSDKDTRWEIDKKIKVMFPSFAYDKYKANINLPSRRTLKPGGALNIPDTSINLWGSLKNMTVLGERHAAICLHYIVKYPELGAIPKPPYYTGPVNENYQAGTNMINMTRYTNAIIGAGMQIDSGSEMGEVRIDANYFPAKPEIEEDPTWLDVVKTATTVIGGFLLLLAGIGSLTSFSLSGLKAKIADFSFTEAAKNWIMNKAGAYATAQVSQYLTEDKIEAIEENEAAIAEAQAQAAQEAAALEQAQNAAGQSEAQVAEARKKLTRRATGSILAIATALLLAQIGG